MNKVLKKLGQLKRWGIGGLLWLTYVYLLARPVHMLLRPYHEVVRQVRLRQRYTDLDRRHRAIRKRWADEHAQFVRSPVLLSEQCPELDAKASQLRQKDRPLQLSRIDRDGLLLPHVTPFWSVPTVAVEDFRPPSRHDVSVVDFNGILGVLKDFRGNLPEFVNEVEVALSLLAAGCPVPGILSINFDTLEIVYEFIPGLTVREALARRGALVRDSDHVVPRSPWARRQLTRQRMLAGKERLSSVVDGSTIKALADGLRAVHRAGFTLEDVKYGNVIIDERDGRPFFIDFERSVSLKGLGRACEIYIRDRDAEKLNAHFDTGLITARSLRTLRRLPGGAVYAPIYAGLGIHWGAIWNPDIGVGRWRYLMGRALPIPPQGRVLDLGANNGYNALQMLRHGAGSIDAVELDPLAIEQGEFLKTVWEWHDNKTYDLTFIRGSHGKLESLDLGMYDQVTAFCTLYYLSREEMMRSVEFIRTISNTFIQQANTDRLISRESDETFEKASLEFTVQLAKQHGFPIVEVIAPKGYSRPLVISRAETSDQGECRPARRAPSALEGAVSG